MEKGTECVKQASSVEYILEEIALLEGSLARGLYFGDPGEKENVFIVYPGNVGAFDQGKKALKVFDTPDKPFKFDVHWLQVEHHRSDSGLCATFSSQDQLKKLLTSKKKYLLFLVSLGRGNQRQREDYIAATVNLFETLIQSWKRIALDKSLRKLGNEMGHEMHNTPWSIVVVPADTLQRHNGDKLPEEWLRIGEHYKENVANPIIKKRLEAAGDGNVKVDLLCWADLFPLGRNYHYQEMRQHLFECYNDPKHKFHAAVDEKINQYHGEGAKGNLTQLQSDKKLIGYSHPTKDSGTQMRLVAREFFSWDEKYEDCYLHPLNTNSSNEIIASGMPDYRANEFIKRAAILQKMQVAFAKKSDSLSASEIVVLYGAGGYGKTVLAAHWFQSTNYRFKLWIKAGEKKADIKTCFIKLAYKLDLVLGMMSEDHIVSSVKTWLENHPGWLMVIDHAVDYAIIETYVPKFGGHVIITSRKSDWFRNVQLPIKMLAVTGMGQIEGKTLLEKYSTRIDAAFPDLVQKLGGMPLALQQVANALKRNKNLSVAEYLADFSCDSTLSPIGNALANSVRLITVELSSQYTKKLDWDTLSLMIRTLMMGCCLLSQEGIPISLLAVYFSHHYAQYPDQASIFDNILTKMIEYSLISGTNQQLNMHAILQEVLRKYCEKPFGKQISINVNSAVTAMADTLLAQCANISKKLPNPIGVHVQAFTEHYEQRMQILEDNEVLYEQLLTYCIKHAATENDYELKAQYLNKRKEVWSRKRPDDVWLLDIDLARAYCGCGDFSKTTKILAALLGHTSAATRERTEDYLRRVVVRPTRLRNEVMNSILIYETLGEYFLGRFDLCNAKTYFEASLKSYELLTRQDFDQRRVFQRSLFVKTRLAQIVCRLGQTKRAHELIRPCHEYFLSTGYQEQLAQSLGVIADILVAENKIAAAVEKNREVLTIFERIYSQDNEKIAEQLTNMSSVVFMTGSESFPEVKRLLVRAYQFYQRNEIKSFHVLKCLERLYKINVMLGTTRELFNLLLQFNQMAELVEQRSPQLRSMIQSLRAQIQMMGQLNDLRGREGSLNKEQFMEMLSGMLLNPALTNNLFHMVGPFNYMPTMFRTHQMLQTFMSRELSGQEPSQPVSFEQKYPALNRFLALMQRIATDPHCINKQVLTNAIQAVIPEMDQCIKDYAGHPQVKEMRAWMTNYIERMNQLDWESEESENFLNEMLASPPPWVNPDRVRYNVRFQAERLIQLGHVPDDPDALEALRPNSESLTADWANIPTLFQRPIRNVETEQEKDFDALLNECDEEFAAMLSHEPTSNVNTQREEALDTLLEECDEEFSASSSRELTQNADIQHDEELNKILDGCYENYAARNFSA